jgi:hypothetical protein
MTSRIPRVLGLAGGLAAVAFLFASQAQAAATYTVKAGSAASGTTVAIKGTTTGTSPQIHFTDVTSGQTLTCKSGTAPGTTKTGSGLAGAGIGHVTGPKTTWTGCSGPLSLKFKVTGIGTWNLNATSYKSGVATGNINNVTAKVSDPGVCTFTAKGSVGVTYTNKTHILAVPGKTAGLTVSGVSGCPGVVSNGDKAKFKANYLLKATTAADNPITITSP